MSDELFVPEDFTVPDGLTAGEFRLAPLGPQHNESDYAAWTASIGHIRATPGFAGASWPHQMSLAEKRRHQPGLLPPGQENSRLAQRLPQDHHGFTE